MDVYRSSIPCCTECNKEICKSAGRGRGKGGKWKAVCFECYAGMDALRGQWRAKSHELRKELELWSEERRTIGEERISYERKIAELRSTHEEHLRTCPAAKNELMLEQGETTTFADACVAAGDTVFHVHRAVLASRSPVLSSMLNLPMREGKEKLIQIEDMSAKGLGEFLFFLYTGRFREGFDVMELGVEVLAAALKYDVKDMEDTLRPLVDAQPQGESSTDADNLVDMLGRLSLPRS